MLNGSVLVLAPMNFDSAALRSCTRIKQEEGKGLGTRLNIIHFCLYVMLWNTISILRIFQRMLSFEQSYLCPLLIRNSEILFFSCIKLSTLWMLSWHKLFPFWGRSYCLSTFSTQWTQTVIVRWMVGLFLLLSNWIVLATRRRTHCPRAWLVSPSHHWKWEELVGLVKRTYTYN